jgi:anti-anti-sigma regulatory factor
MPAASSRLMITTEPGRATLVGIIDERAELTPVLDAADTAQRALTVDLGDVTFINSLGIRQWMRFVSAAQDRDLRLRLRRVSEPMVQQMNMIEAARGRADIESFFAPYACDGCGREDSLLLDTSAHAALISPSTAPAMPCPECNHMMAMQESPQRYFLFLVGLPEP